jgi:hypothetical protein
VCTILTTHVEDGLGFKVQTLLLVHLLDSQLVRVKSPTKRSASGVPSTCSKYAEKIICMNIIYIGLLWQVAMSTPRLCSLYLQKPCSEQISWDQCFDTNFFLDCIFYAIFDILEGKIDPAACIPKFTKVIVTP